MFFGNASVFAIEIDGASKHSTTLLGTILLWIGGEKVGDGVDGCDIVFGLLSFLDPLLHSSAQRQAAMPFGNGSEIVDELYRIRFADSDAHFDEREQLLWRLRKYINPSAYDIEGFDRFFIVILRNTPGECRIIWRGKDSAETKEYSVPEADYRSVLKDCHDWISQQMGIALPPFPVA